MITADRLERLQQVADYRTVRKTVRGGAIGSLIFGGLALAAGLISPMDVILVGVGAILLGTGVWNFFAPRPTGIIVDGLTLIMVGGYNLSGILVSVTHGGAAPAAGLWVKIGLFQIIWGAASFWRFMQYRDAFKAPPTGAEMLELNGIATDVWKTRVKESTDTIDFIVSGFRATRWKAHLEPEAAVIVTNRGAEVRVCGKDAFDVVDLGKTMLGKTRKVEFRVSGKAWKGTIGPESLERFQQWKTGVVVPQPYAA